MCAGYEQLHFPDATINNGYVNCDTDVIVGDNVSRRECLHSSSGAVYEIERRIKKCIYGYVNVGVVLEFSVEHTCYRRTSKLVAIKSILKRRLDVIGKTCVEDPKKEIAALQFMGNNHPNVMGQIECVRDNDNNYYSIMDLADGDELFCKIKMNGKCTEEDARLCFSQILSGLEYLHSLGICHRDLSTDNLVMMNDGTCSIIDFGMCVLFPMDENGSFLPIPHLTPSAKTEFLSPECYTRMQRIFVGSTSDVWSLGVILCTLLLGFHIFKYPSTLCKNYRRFMRGQFETMLNEEKIELSSDAIDLVQRILIVDPQKRLSLQEIRQHPWLNPPA